MSVLVGSGANQVPVNGSLGKLAFKDTALPFVELKSSVYQVTVNDVNKVLVVSGTTTITLPLASEVWGKREPFIIAIKAVAGATVTVARSGSDTIETVAANKSMTANTGLWFFPVSASAWESF